MPLIRFITVESTSDEIVAPVWHRATHTAIANPSAAIARANHAPSVTGKLSAALPVLSPGAAEVVEEAAPDSPAALIVVGEEPDAGAAPTTLVMVDVIGEVPDGPALIIVVVRSVEVTPLTAESGKLPDVMMLVLADVVEETAPLSEVNVDKVVDDELEGVGETAVALYPTRVVLEVLIALLLLLLVEPELEHTSEPTITVLVLRSAGLICVKGWPAAPVPFG
ncbi:hypothetical protein LTR17_008339 [Elasticomyces elasticus]|nr:hypothetical protein LTR17_008339 [Elasticomyces elasticus]